MHSSRMRTIRLPSVHALVASVAGVGIPGPGGGMGTQPPSRHTHLLWDTHPLDIPTPPQW